MEKSKIRKRVTIALPPHLIRAMSLVRDVVRISNTAQIELGLRWYLEKHHKSLLDSKKINL